MKFQVSALALLVSSAAMANDIVPAVKQQQAVFLNDGVIHTVTNGVISNGDLLLVDGKIAAVGTDLSAPAGATVIELQGKHVYPGLIALGNQLGLLEIEAVRATDDTREVTETNPDVRAQIAYNADSEVIPVTRANGFSYTLVYPGGNMLMGQSSLMQLDAWNWQDATVKAGVGLHIRWPATSTLSSPWNPQKPEEVAKENAKAEQALRDYLDQAKSYVDAKAAGIVRNIDSRWEAMIPVFKGERPVYAHADDARQVKMALQYAKEYGFKLVIVGGSDAGEVAPLLAAANVPVIFTHPFGVPERDDEPVDYAYSTPAKLQAAGVTVALSLDGYWDTRNVVFGAGQAQAFGLTAEQALATVTINAAKIVGLDKQLGSLEVGKAASVIVSDGDVMDYGTSKIRYMWIDGRAVDLNNRHKQLHDKYQQRYSR